MRQIASREVSQFGYNAELIYIVQKQKRSKVTINAGGRIIAATARELSGAEREQYWQVAVGYYKVYQVYTDRSGREPPVFLLEPK